MPTAFKLCARKLRTKEVFWQATSSTATAVDTTTTISK